MKILFEQLKAVKEIPLPELIQSYGIEIKSQAYKNQYICLCPFHEDTNPSLNITKKGSKWLWHCFGCGAKGTIIDFVMKMEGINFVQAYKKLIKDHRVEIKNEELKEDSLPVEDTGSLRVLERVIDHYHRCLGEDRRGLEYLVNRGIIESSILKDKKIGFVNGTLKTMIHESGAVIEQLKEIGILNEKGNEFFFNCVVFPIFDGDGNAVSLYGRSITGNRHLYLPGQHRGVFNVKALQSSKRIYLTESIIDSLSLMQLGIFETVPLYGTNGLTDAHIRLLKEYLIKEVILCLDNDNAGVSASMKIGKILMSMGIKIQSISLAEGIKDINDYLIKGGTKEGLLLKSSDEIEETRPEIIEEESQVSINFKNRQYRIRGLTTTRLDQMRVNIKITFNEKHHLDTLDLYSSRQRESFRNQCHKTLGINMRELNQDITFIVDYLENMQGRLIDGRENTKQAPEMDEKDKQEALRLLKSDNIFEEILSDFKKCGHVGEENNLLLGYLASISRKLTTPLALLVVSRSASGKTTLQDAILSFTPPEDYEKYTRMTDQALFYKSENALKHKLLAIEEEQGASGSAYSLRNLQSSHGLSIAVTTKDPVTGKLRTEDNKVSGPTAIMITTTYSEAIDFETYNRFITLTVDETNEQTKKILERQRMNESIEGIIAKKNRLNVQRKHHNVHRLLKPMEVANPYSEQLTFIDTMLRSRREQPKYLAIIKTVALMRQYQKEIKQADDLEYIEVDIKDIEVANRVSNEILGQNLDELCPPARNLLEEIERMVKEMASMEGIAWDELIFTRRDVRHYCGWSEYQVRMHMKQLEELEYIYPVNGKQGQRYAYKLMWNGEGKEGQKFVMGLKDVTKLVRSDTTSSMKA